MKYWSVYAVALGIAMLVIVTILSRNHNAQNTVSPASQTTMSAVELGGNTIRVTVAATQAEQEQGLGGRNGLAADEGMLFVFPEVGDYAFWMKNMSFSIDIVWLDASGKVIYIAPSVSPDTYPTAFDPHMDAQYVIELPAGYMAAHAISVGDIARI